METLFNIQQMTKAASLTVQSVRKMTMPHFGVWSVKRHIVNRVLRHPTKVVLAKTILPFHCQCVLSVTFKWRQKCVNNVRIHFVILVSNICIEKVDLLYIRLIGYALIVKFVISFGLGNLCVYPKIADIQPPIAVVVIDKDVMQ